MAIEEKDLPTGLVTSYSDNKCGFFVGSGLSSGAGYPDWCGLLINLIDKAEASRLLEADRATECRVLAGDPNKFLLIAEEMKDVLGVEFKTFVEEQFANDDKEPTGAHHLLVSLKKNNFIITTNYDQLIEKAFVKIGELSTPYKYYEAHAIQRQLYRRKFFLLKAHGDAQTAAENIILTDKDYRRILYKEPGYQSVLQSIFTMYSVIFVGSSLQDPELKLLLNYINAAFPEGGIPHYAVMSKDNITRTEEIRWKKDYNMTIIPIAPDNNYEDIETFFKILIDKES